MKRGYQLISSGRNEEADMQACNKVTLVDRNPEPFGVALVNTRKVGKKQPDDLVRLAEQIQNADTFVNANACNRLAVIAEQIQFLQRQAEQILVDAKTNTDLHHVACNFTKVPGKIYNVYRRPSGQKYLSLLSPEEWCSPHEFLGSYRLEFDQSWTPVQNIPKKDAEFEMVKRIFQSSEGVNFAKAIQDSSMDVS